MTSKKDFFDQCLAFDWFYEYSDDFRVWSAGNQAYGQLRSAMFENEKELRPIFQAFSLYNFERIGDAPDRKLLGAE